MSQPELPVDPPSDWEATVDWEAVEEAAAEAGCRAFHLALEDTEKETMR